MTKRSFVYLLALIAFLTMQTYADSFEFLNFTPPSGWVKQSKPDGITYQRSTGVGLIYFYNSTASTGTAAVEFARMWQAKVGPTLPGASPEPAIEHDANYSGAIGSRTVDAKGTPTYISLLVFVGRGRTLGFLTMAAGNDVQKELAPFFKSLDTTPSGNLSDPGAIGGEIEIEFIPPAGYKPERNGSVIILKPATVSEQTPCVYGISPSRASKGNLEMDARDALLEPLPGWQVKGDKYNGMRGKGADGWQYLWLRTDVQLPGPTYQYLSAMSMAVETGPNRVGIIWGFGNPAKCTLDDVSFARLFFSLRPRGWTPDGGRALERDLVGTWRNTQSSGMAQYKFASDNHFEYGLGTITRMGIFETTAASALDGRYDLTGATLVMTPSVRGRAASRHKVRIYDEYVTGRWTRAMSLLSEEGGKALDVQYMRVE